MNIKTIIVGSLAVGLAIGGTLFNFSSENDKGVYTPRTLNNGGLYGQAGYAEYMHMLKADPATGEIDYNLVAQARLEVMKRSKQNSKAALGLNWAQMGPDNVGGRTRAVLVDQSNSNIVYAGSIAGGLFVSTDGTQTWTQVAGHDGVLGENLAVSCITQTSNGRIFFGTGASFENAGGNGGSGFIGNGVYEYVPSTGQVVPVVTNTGAVPNNSAGSLWSYTNAIASYGNRLYLGTKDGMVWADPDAGGVYPSTFSGWTNPIEVAPTILEQGTVHDIDVGSDGSMVVCFSNKVYYSNSDAFGSFTKRSYSGVQRIAAAIAPSNPNVIYVVTVETGGLGDLNNIEISTDKGVNWDIIVPGGSPSIDPLGRGTNGSGQGAYDLAIAVDPSDWGHMMVGGIRLYEWQYTSGSNPIGGSWLMVSVLSEFAEPYYVHADNHTIVWPSSSRIYIGNDGGVFRSIDGGGTWQERNLGFNVTTFYDMATASNGWFVGGAQDNGNQMFTFGAFGEVTPLATTEIQNTDANLTFGDGFDVAFSNIGQVVFATAQNSAVIRSAGPGGGSFFDGELMAKYQGGGQPFHTVIKTWETWNDPLTLDSIKIEFDTTYGYQIAPGDTVFAGDTLFAGDTINYTSLTNGYGLQYIVPSQVILSTPMDSIMLADPIQNKFVIRMNDGVYFTKDAARLNAPEMQWHKISNTASAENFEFSPDGNHLFLGTATGSVIRISGLSLANDSLGLDIRSGVDSLTQTTIATGLGGVVSLAIDPNDGNNMIATSTSYNTGNHVYRCTNALTASTSSGNFSMIQGSGGTALPKMPVYDAVIDYNDKDKVIIATEWGVWTTDNAFSASNGAFVDWTDESGNGMCHVPIHAVVQQHLRSNNALNSGYVYLGTHGRGFYMSTDLFTAVEDNNDDFLTNEDEDFVSNLTVYPNPISNAGTIDFDLNQSATTTVNVFNLSGSLVKTISLGTKQKGNHKVNFDVSSLSVGTYILSLNSGTDKKVAKFIVNR